MKKITHTYSNPKQAVLPILIQDYLDICDPVLTFNRFMGEIDLEKYLKEIPKHEVGRLRYNPVSMLKTILFGFMTCNIYILTVLSLKPTQTSIPGYGRKRLKNPDTACLRRSLPCFRKLILSFNTQG